MEVLFGSRVDSERTTGKLRLIQAHPRLHPEPVVQRDTFADKAGTIIWGTVLRDAGAIACGTIRGHRTGPDRMSP